MFFQCEIERRNELYLMDVVCHGFKEAKAKKERDCILMRENQMSLGKTIQSIHNAYINSKGTYTLILSFMLALQHWSGCVMLKSRHNIVKFTHLLTVLFQIKVLLFTEQICREERLTRERNFEEKHLTLTQRFKSDQGRGSENSTFQQSA